MVVSLSFLSNLEDKFAKNRLEEEEGVLIGESLFFSFLERELKIEI